MTEVRVERKPAFMLVGRIIWIAGTDGNDVFGRFWQQSRENGLVELLNHIRGSKQDTVIDNGVFGVSCVEKDPSIEVEYLYLSLNYMCRASLVIG